MLTGEPPFYSEDIPKMYKNIKEGKLFFPSSIEKNTKAFILKLMDRNPKNRPGYKDYK